MNSDFGLKGLTGVFRVVDGCKNDKKVTFENKEFWSSQPYVISIF